ncbi:MAG: ABC transporter permease subunit [Deltaproteobacteria bacterium]|jgi:ABC-type spermidine/putrescine transport system permease subunit I|nr:ABC transporter permease subunit [Deltaproteobacteria bacterium]
MKAGPAGERLAFKILRLAALLAIVLTPVALVCVEYVYPFLSSLGSSLRYKGELSLYNYQYALGVYGGDIAFTIYVSLLSLILVMLIAVLAGGWMIVKGGGVIEFIFKIPLFIPFVVVGHAMRTFLAPKGLLNSMLSQIGLVDLSSPPNLIYGALGIVISLAWKQTAFALVLVMAAYRSVDRSYLEAARNFGASTWRQITGILLPLSKGSVGAASVLIFSSFLQNFSTVMMMGNPGGRKHIMVDIYHIINYLNDLPLANALGVISYLLALGSAVLYLREGMRKNA